MNDYDKFILGLNQHFGYAGKTLSDSEKNDKISMVFFNEIERIKKTMVTLEERTKELEFAVANLEEKKGKMTFSSVKDFK